MSIFTHQSILVFHIYIRFVQLHGFCFFVKKWAISKKGNTLIWLGLLLGMIFLIRPTNIFIVLIVPFLFTNWLDFKNTIFELFTIFKSKIVISVLLFLGLIFLQIYNVHSQIGRWTLNSYSGENFEFLLNPKWFEVLFGFEKGFFVYNPMLLLVLPAFVWGMIKRTYFTLGFLLFFIVITYITSSWWCWWYGGGLGMRPFVDFTSLFILMIALFYVSIQSWLKAIVILYSICMIYFYQILQIQFNRNILHYDLMTKEKFWSIFLKTDSRFSWMTHYDEYQIKGKHKKEIVSFKPTEFTMKYDNEIKIESFTPKKEWFNSKLGVRFKGELFLTNPESNPNLKLTYFKNGQITKQIDLFIGNKIDELNEFYPFSKDFIDTTKYKNIDSLQFYIPHGYPIVKAKNLKCIFYSLE